MVMAALCACGFSTPARAQDAGGVAPLETAAIVRAYAPAAERLVGAALVDDTAWRRLEWLSDRIGHRLSGSPQLDAAIAWAVEEMKKLEVDESKYFWVHHTAADTFDKVDRTSFGQCVATLGVVAYVVAELPGPLGAASAPR